MLIKIITAVVTLLFVLAIIIATRPDIFRVSRSAFILAPPTTVFSLVNDFHAWEAWSPWAKLDPAAKNRYEGPAAGTGASFGWAGNNKVGEGKMTITESRPGEFIQIRLDFIKPFVGTSTAEFTFKPENGGTLVTWSTHGKNNFMSKAMSLVMNCEKMLGGFFEQGLAQIKAIAEAAPKS